MPDAKQEAAEYLRRELEKRLGPWQGVDGKGNPQMKPQLHSLITLMPLQAQALLDLIEEKQDGR